MSGEAVIPSQELINSYLKNVPVDNNKDESDLNEVPKSENNSKNGSVLDTNNAQRRMTTIKRKIPSRRNMTTKRIVQSNVRRVDANSTSRENNIKCELNKKLEYIITDLQIIQQKTNNDAIPEKIKIVREKSNLILDIIKKILSSDFKSLQQNIQKLASNIITYKFINPLLVKENIKEPPKLYLKYSWIAEPIKIDDDKNPTLSASSTLDELIKKDVIATKTYKNLTTLTEGEIDSIVGILNTTITNNNKAEIKKKLQSYTMDNNNKVLHSLTDNTTNIKTILDKLYKLNENDAQRLCKNIDILDSVLGRVDINVNNAFNNHPLVVICKTIHAQQQQQHQFQQQKPRKQQYQQPKQQ